MRGAASLVTIHLPFAEPQTFAPADRRFVVIIFSFFSLVGIGVEGLRSLAVASHSLVALGVKVPVECNVEEQNGQNIVL
jgi:hypothetical protein